MILGNEYQAQYIETLLELTKFSAHDLAVTRWYVNSSVEIPASSVIMMLQQMP